VALVKSSHQHETSEIFYALNKHFAENHTRTNAEVKTAAKVCNTNGELVLRYQARQEAFNTEITTKWM
jgi:hypothetical protein